MEGGEEVSGVQYLHSINEAEDVGMTKSLESQVSRAHQLYLQMSIYYSRCTDIISTQVIKKYESRNYSLTSSSVFPVNSYKNTVTGSPSNYNTFDLIEE